MYLEHFSLKERPFSISPDPRFLFMSNRYREALAHLTYGVEDGGGFVLLTGEVGTGKTTVCRCLLQQLPEKTRLAFVLNPKLNSVELLATICDELKIEYPEACSSLKILTDKLSQYLLACYENDLSVVVMIDEAQNIDTDVLEQIRLLTNLETNQKKLLQIILVGQPELQEKLAQRNLRQLAQRITARYHLRPLNLKESMAYILHRIRIAGGRENLFSRKAIVLLHAATSGVPRLLNTICDRALVAASYRNKNLVSYSIMQEAINDVMGNNLSVKSERVINQQSKGLMRVLYGFIAIVLLLLSYWLGQSSKLSVNNENAIETLTQTDKNRQHANTVLPSSKSGLADSSSIKNLTHQYSGSLIQEMLKDQRWDINGQWSMQQLLALWQIEYNPLSDGSSCDFAASYGLVCSTQRGNWQQLRYFNRPAILEFSAGLQGEFWGVLKSLSGYNAELIFGKQEVTIQLERLSVIWTGNFKILWQAPKGYNGDIKLHQEGIAVNWLAKKMNQLIDPSLQESSLFESSLLNAVKTYQTSKNINADGIAGMQTILAINEDSLVGIPQLQKH